MPLQLLLRSKRDRLRQWCLGWTVRCSMATAMQLLLRFFLALLLLLRTLLLPAQLLAQVLANIMLMIAEPKSDVDARPSLLLGPRRHPYSVTAMLL